MIVVAPTEVAPLDADSVTTEVIRAIVELEGGTNVDVGEKKVLEEGVKSDEEVAKVVGGVDDEKVGEVKGTVGCDQRSSRQSFTSSIPDELDMSNLAFKKLWGRIGSAFDKE